MKRASILRAQMVRHPFRRRLPVHILALSREEEAAAQRGANPDDKDWKLFVLSFCAFFTVFYTFIA